MPPLTSPPPTLKHSTPSLFSPVEVRETTEEHGDTARAWIGEHIAGLAWAASRKTWAFEPQLQFNPQLEVRVMGTACAKAHAVGKCAHASEPGVSTIHIATRAATKNKYLARFIREN
eukprot:6211283-Pleurochrysis_carterae.AAC.1